MLVEILFYGRGGQGAVTAANVLVEAAMYEGKHGQGFPFFGAERRGAPVTAFARLSDRPILRHGMFNEADVIVVLDHSLFELGFVKRGVLRDNGVLVANVPENFALEPSMVNAKGRYRAFAVNATRIAKELGLVIAGWPVVNTSMLGAFAKATGLVGLESVKKAIKAYFPGKAGESNALAVERAYHETKLLFEVS